jgi:hypothetical protein
LAFHGYGPGWPAIIQIARNATFGIPVHYQPEVNTPTQLDSYHNL